MHAGKQAQPGWRTLLAGSCQAAAAGRRGLTAGAALRQRHSTPERSAQAESRPDPASLLAQLRSGDTRLQCQAAAAVADLASSGGRDAAAAAVRAGAAPLLVALLASACADVQQQAARALHSLASGRHGPGSGEDTDSADSDGSNTKDRYFYGSDILTAVREAGAIEPLAALLSSPDPGGQEWAAAALMALASHPEHYSGFHEPEVAWEAAIPPLVDALCSGNAAAQLAATRAVRRLAKCSVLREPLADAAALEPLVELLSADSACLQQQAARGLLLLLTAGGEPEEVFLVDWEADWEREFDGSVRGLVVDACIVGTIVYAGAMQPLVALLGSPRPGVQKAAVKLLAPLAAFHQREAVEAGALGALLRLLASDDTGVQEAAAEAVFDLAVGVDSEAAFELARALVTLLPSASYAVQESATKALQVLADCSDTNKAAVAEAGGIRALVEMLHLPDRPLVQASAAIALGTLAEDEGIRRRVVCAGAKAALQRLLSACDSDDGAHDEAHDTALHALRMLRAR